MATISEKYKDNPDVLEKFNPAMELTDEIEAEIQKFIAEKEASSAIEVNELPADDKGEGKKETVEFVDGNEEDTSGKWRAEYDEILKNFAEANSTTWERTTGDDEYTGMKGNLSGIEIDYQNPNSVQVDLSNASPKQAEDFVRAQLEIAKQRGLKIPYNEEWGEKLKAAALKVKEENPEYFINFPAPEKEVDANCDETPVRGEARCKIVKARLKSLLNEGVEGGKGWKEKEASQDSKTRITEKLKNLSAGGKIGEELLGERSMQGQGAAVAMYALAVLDGDKAKMDKTAEALKFYNIGSVEAKKDEDGKYDFDITAKNYSEYSDEEKAGIAKAIEELKSPKTGSGIDGRAFTPQTADYQY